MGCHRHSIVPSLSYYWLRLWVVLVLLVVPAVFVVLVLAVHQVKHQFELLTKLLLEFELLIDLLPY